jgi:hypothetical protein
MNLCFPRLQACLALIVSFGLIQLANATNYTWNVANGNWSVASDWTGAGGPPGTADTAIFGNTDATQSATSVNNTVDSGFNNSITGLTYNSGSISPLLYNVTQIPTGQTLTVTGPVLVGGLNESTAYTTYAYMTGGGTFQATGASFTVQNYGSASGANAMAYLNLSALSYFVYNNNAGTISIEDNPGSLTRLGGSMNLAAVSNYITVDNLNLGTSSSAQAGPAGTLTLGPGTNIINVATFNIANNKSTYTVTNSSSGGLYSGLYLRGISGADSDATTIIVIGNRSVNGGTGTTTGNMFLDGSPVDIKASTLTIGENGGATAGTSGVGNFQFDHGTVSASSIQLAYAPTLGNATGTINVGASATLNVGSGGLSLVAQNSGGTSAGALDIATGGAVNCTGNITQATAAGTGTINLGGTLQLAMGNVVGATNIPINTFNISNNATLQCSFSSIGQTNAFVSTIGWPATGSFTVNVAALPPGAPANSTFTIVQYGSSSGSYVSPTLSLPNGVSGSLATTGNALVLTISTAVPGPPPAPTDISGIAENDGVTLTWTDSGASSYNIFRSSTLSGTYVQIATNVIGTTFIDTNATGGTLDYYYEVVGINVNGASPNSSPATVPEPYGVGNQLGNPGFELDPLETNWTTVGTVVIKAIGTNTYDNSATGVCPQDPMAELIVGHGGTNVGNIYGNFNGALNRSSWIQSFGTSPASTWNAGAWTYASHEDLPGSQDNFYYELDFLSSSGTLLAAYESFVVQNLTCSETTPFPVDTWVYLAVTNQMEVVDGTNTGTVIGSMPSGVLTAPSGTATVKWEANFNQNGNDGGSIYLDDCELNLLSGLVGPTMSSVQPNGIILCTNKDLTCAATSATSTITNVAVKVQTNGLTGFTNTFTTNLTAAQVSGLGTSSVSVSYPLMSNLVYNVTVIATDANGLFASSSATFDTMAPPLVIEAEDFNYSGGSFMDTPSNGGLALYADAPLGVSEIDLQKAANGTQAADGSYYRSDDVIICGKAAPNNGTEQKYVTAAANGDTTDVPVEVGYNSVGDWLDYTRDFGSAAYPANSAPAGTYTIWGRLATDGSGAALDFYQVTNGQDTTSQTTSLLGTFNFTGNNWNTFDYVPLSDNFGNLVSITLSGTETFRSTVVGNPNIDFYMLMPAATIITPVLLYAYPDGRHPFESTNHFTFTVGPANGSDINSSGIDVVLNGVDITSGVNLTATGASWTGSYPIVTNAVYTAVINVTNTAQLSSSFTINFDTFNISNYQWEAVDYDFSTNNGSSWISGLFIDNSVPSGDTTAPQTGELATNSYFGFPTGFSPAQDPNSYGAIAQQGIDIYFPDAQTGGDEYYRADGVGSQPSGDYLRPKFVAAQTEFSDPNIGPMQIGYFDQNNWLNYTRHYPTNNYYIWGRLAGGNGPFSGTTLSVLTSGYGTPTQATNVLGTFSDPNAAGWETFHWIPLLNTNGAQAVVSLGGLATLKLTSGNNLNVGFFMLVPAPASAFTVTPSLVSGQLNLSFPTASGYTYYVQYKSSLTGTWTAVGSPTTGDGNTHTVTESLSGTQGYYQVVAEQ